MHKSPNSITSAPRRSYLPILILTASVIVAFAASRDTAFAGSSSDYDWSACTVQYDCNAYSALEQGTTYIWINAQGFVSPSPYTSPFIRLVGNGASGCDWEYSPQVSWYKSTSNAGINNVWREGSAPHPASCDYISTSRMQGTVEFISEGVYFEHEIFEHCSVLSC
jgi:hypothetical protein